MSSIAIKWDIRSNDHLGAVSSSERHDIFQEHVNSISYKINSAKMEFILSSAISNFWRFSFSLVLLGLVISLNRLSDYWILGVLVVLPFLS